MKRPNNGRINWWKWAFVVLVAANLAFALVLSSRLLTVREPVSKTVTSKQTKDLYIGRFETNRDQLNQTLAAYLADYQTKDMTYQVLVGSTTILFEGAYQFFGYQIPLYVYFTPYQLEDGTIRLVVDSFSVGTLPLPSREVLQYLKATYKLPKFVTVSPKQGAIHIDLTKFDNKENIYAKARTIDLLNDKISLDIFKKK